jgi:hypothetical protein
MWLREWTMRLQEPVRAGSAVVRGKQQRFARLDQADKAFGRVQALEIGPGQITSLSTRVSRRRSGSLGSERRGRFAAARSARKATRFASDAAATGE